MKFKRRFRRKFKYNKKRSFMFIFFFLVCLSFGLGYSLIQTDINIFGTTVLKDNRWDVHFENIQEVEGAVSPTSEPEITNNTTVTFSAKLKNPGDKYEFLIDVVNTGTIDAKIGSIMLSPELTSEQQNYFSYEVKYESGLDLSENQALDAGSSETLKVSFKYLEQEDNSLYPGDNQTFNVTLSVDYAQGIGEEVIHPYLYGAVQRVYENGGSVRKYGGAHHDSFTREPSKDIYYWQGSDQNLLNNNVIFANYCWQIIRTTDTGGVKLIYNGRVSDNKCNNVGNAQIIDSVPYNNSTRSLAYLGYMYNKVYISQTKNLSSTETVLKKFTPTGSNWVGDSIVWENNKYKLLNTSLFSDYSNISDLIGKYTFNNADQNYAFNGVEYIADVIDNSLLSVTLYNGADINSYNVRYVYGENFTDNGDGTYTIDNPIEFYRTDWYSNYSAVKNKYLCRNVSNNTCSDLRYVISVSNVDYSYFLVKNDYKYANSFTFENGIYTLNNDAINYWNVTNGTNITAMSNAHYTCWNATGECSTISYIYYLGGTTFNYININDGKSVEDALDEMLYGDNVNVIDSNAKSVVDGWYKNNIIDYSDYLEETIFCNDRTASNMMGWNPNGGIITDIINFDGYSSTSLKCLNNSDKYSIDNPIAKLKYSVGLTTRAEMQNMGNARNATVDYRLMTPSYYRGDNIMFTTIVMNNGNVTTRNVTNNMGLRPSVSLKPKTIYLSGDGSKDNPLCDKLESFYLHF